MELTHKILTEVIVYNPKNGGMWWAHRPLKIFKNKQAYAAWNGRYANKPLGCTTTGGSINVCIFQKFYLAHKLVWFHYYREWPEDTILHINGNKSDNRIENLIQADYYEFHKDKKPKKPNELSHDNVWFDEKCQKWRASIQLTNKPIGLGTFDNKPKAIQARDFAHRFYGIHEKNINI